MSLVATGRRLLDAIGRRDFDAAGRCFAARAEFRVLTPGPLREQHGPEEAAERYRRWFGSLAEFAVLESDVEHIADRIRIRYRIRGIDPEKGLQINEHTGYAAVEDGLIAAMTLTCTGFRPGSGG